MMAKTTIFLALFLLLLLPAKIIGLWWAVRSPFHLDQNKICKVSRKFAGVTYAVTQACSMGELLQCGCDDEVSRHAGSNSTWEWGGCADNIEFGYQKSKEFMDAQDKRRSDIRTLINLHNNEAGRLAIKKNMRIECKCHGLSGTCTVKTCWQKMPVFRFVGNRLKEKFNRATEVIGGNDGNELLPEGETIKPPTDEDLVYTAKSPDFCEPNRRVGSLGTGGRNCNNTSLDVGGCDQLCCGRGYKEETITVTENCKCRFHWCCVVNCDTCTTKKTIHKCNGYRS
ncbi:wingless-type MMTV integration site family, member 6 precursor [Saccoglossus kowalevskii]|uniref:Protein Wnt n=1 Tax=Saccoglossus kowalevskii TaxID=10224 RepID=D1LXI3_SACKO|nr:wingless-type MMTV integration site family, member 6 precursor [Saccoglossus kowalevskii]ACY92689.1 Wnt6 [Saccoglossus kowalevskii]